MSLPPPPGIRDLIRAIEDEGLAPARHQEIMARHRREWPTLWAAIDKIVQDDQDRRKRQDAFAQELREHIAAGHMHWPEPQVRTSTMGDTVPKVAQEKRSITTVVDDIK